MTLQQERLKTRMVGLLLFITLAAVAFQSLQFTQILRIDQNARFSHSVVDDRSNGGTSNGRVETVNGKLQLHCEIQASEFAWPYCDISFDLQSAPVKGLNLSRYSHIKLWVKYLGAQHSGIRFQTRNFNASYAKPDQEATFKYNSIEIYPEHNTYPVIVPLKSFQVPTWWLVGNKIPAELSGPEFSNTLWVEVATGNNIKPGHYILEIERLEFIGKLIDDQHLYMGLLALWGLAALGYVISQMGYIRRELNFSTQRQKELESLNQLLNVKSIKLEEQLTRDTLTGAYNRDGIAHIFESHMHSQRSSKLSMIFMDIDHFKQVNDTHGHNTGDQVLIEFTQVLSKSTRTSDVLARWGGEEFVLICPNTDLMKAAHLAEKLRSNILEHTWPQLIPLTASFGVAEMQNESPTDFIARADKALYAAKEQGRNRVIISLPKGEGYIAITQDS
jgi:diguanylate cyclase (GGDEF)-like protein